MNTFLCVVFLPNYDKTCSKCLCEAASSCNRTFQCENGYCGMYRISRIYWAEAGKIVLPGDDPDRQGGNVLINNIFIFTLENILLT